MTRLKFFVGLDLGQAADYTAVTVLDRKEEATGGRHADGTPRVEASYELRYLERFPLGTGYPDVVARVTAMMRSDQLDGRALLVVDATGVGRPVWDLLTAEGLTMVAVLVHGGAEFTIDPRTRMYHIPKRELVTTTKVLLQQGRLKLADSLPDVRVLRDELLRFQVRISEAGHDAYGQWREGLHDDLVFALALACWAAEYAAKRAAAGHDSPIRVIDFRVTNDDAEVRYGAR